MRMEIRRVAAQHGAVEVRVFGSRLRGESGPESDLDLLVTLAPGGTLIDLVAIKQDLEDLLGCPIHALTEASVSPYIREEVLQEAVPL
jgi:predicted nucleotidyltransferase